MVFVMPALSDSPSQLSLTKSFSLSTLKVNGSTDVTIIVENKGGGDAKNIIIVDTVRDGFESVSGQSPVTITPGQNPVTFPTIDTLKSGENREFIYTIKATTNTIGDYKMTNATATYQDIEGKSHSIYSNDEKFIHVPGFEVILAGIGIIIALVFRRR